MAIEGITRPVLPLLVDSTESTRSTARSPDKPRLLAVCFNRTLASFLEKKIRIDFEQRTGRPVPEGTMEVCPFNTLMYRLTSAGLWKYQTVRNAEEMVRAIQYALYRMGYPSGATAHGFRSTASNILNENRFVRDVIERQLAHCERDTVRAAYNHPQYMPERRRMMQWWADHLYQVATLASTVPTLR